MLKIIVPAIALTMIAAPVHAKQFSFQYKTYELENTKAAEGLYRRLERRVKNFCTSSGRKTIAQGNAERQCMTSTLRDAVADINHPVVNRMHARAHDGAQEYARY